MSGTYKHTRVTEYSFRDDGQQLWVALLVNDAEGTYQLPNHILTTNEKLNLADKDKVLSPSNRYPELLQIEDNGELCLTLLKVSNKRYTHKIPKKAKWVSLAELTESEDITSDNFKIVITILQVLLDNFSKITVCHPDKYDISEYFNIYKAVQLQYAKHLYNKFYGFFFKYPQAYMSFFTRGAWYEQYYPDDTIRDLIKKFPFEPIELFEVEDKLSSFYYGFRLGCYFYGFIYDDKPQVMTKDVIESTDRDIASFDPASNNFLPIFARKMF